MGETDQRRGSGRVITITSGKGGVGKTTTTANVGAALADRGKSVVLIDADIGLRNLDIVLGLENRIVYDLVDVVEGTCRLRQAMIRDKRLNNLHLIPAAQTRDKEAVSPEQMRALCNDLRQQFDFILIDSPAGIEQGFRNAIAGADEVLVVTNPEVSSVRDADRIIGLVEAAELPTPRLIINRLNPLLVSRGDMMSMEDVTDILSIPLVGIVPDDESIVTSTNRGEPAALNAQSRAGQAFRDIAARLTGEDVPMAVQDEPKDGALRRILRMLKIGGNQAVPLRGGGTH
ncbi:septum site-determining protein MinD [Nitrolancea hollandica]|uniref:Septum site-determining protein MinD n=1 Tax=Nitrolancea hollandica Lb TaxID=1129897 RepID=I4EIH8_9BACT|nr:septum site-determining protein MinD [Nitrolancea hollandica]CCF84490.1 Septum site-determining protein minD (Cell division inhibitor minD) [Nitrolancea hollandica Lb]